MEKLSEQRFEAIQFFFVLFNDDWQAIQLNSIPLLGHQCLFAHQCIDLNDLTCLSRDTTLRYRTH